MNLGQSVYSGADRRRDERRDIGVAAKLKLVGLTVEGRLANVAARGVCFVTRDQHLRVDAMNYVEVDFTLPAADGDQHVVRQVRVVRVETIDEHGERLRRIGLEWKEPLILDV
jgi:hypothetical protein